LNNGFTVMKTQQLVFSPEKAQDSTDLYAASNSTDLSISTRQNNSVEQSDTDSDLQDLRGGLVATCRIPAGSSK